MIVLCLYIAMFMQASQSTQHSVATRNYQYNHFTEDQIGSYGLDDLSSFITKYQ